MTIKDKDLSSLNFIKKLQAKLGMKTPQEAAEYLRNVIAAQDKTPIKDKDLDIETMLVVSTGHIKDFGTSEALRTDDSVLESEYGYVLRVNDNDWENKTPELKQLADLCRKHNCTHLRFDCDARPIDSIASFNW
jgi:hypothetical protein